MLRFGLRFGSGGGRKAARLLALSSFARSFSCFSFSNSNARRRAASLSRVSSSAELFEEFTPDVPSTVAGETDAFTALSGTALSGAVLSVTALSITFSAAALPVLAGTMAPDDACGVKAGRTGGVGTRLAMS